MNNHKEFNCVNCEHGNALSQKLNVYHCKLFKKTSKPQKEEGCIAWIAKATHC